MHEHFYFKIMKIGATGRIGTKEMFDVLRMFNVEAKKIERHIQMNDLN